ncbi:MAG: COX15/CtaA family protein [Candidatus Brachytrichaceae bacterium NZ_4S206]
MSNTSRMTHLRRYAWGVLAFNVLVILWGAVVRATGSGAGCGDHWPLCDGHVIPPAPALATFIELFHRLTSGLALILVAVMWIAARRVFAPGHRARRFASISLILIVVESLIGAFIVLQSLTGMDDSALRAVVIAVHQANTLFLLGAITLTAWFADRIEDGVDTHVTPPRALRLLLALGVAGLIVLGATGAITALGDTLFRPDTFEAGWQAKFSPTAHFLIRLRVVHPAIAMLMGLYVIATAWRAYQYASDTLSRRLATTLTGLFFIQCAVGVLNVILLAPVWMQIVHLLLADAVWIAFVLLAASILAPQPNRMPAQRGIPVASPALTAK